MPFTIRGTPAPTLALPLLVALAAGVLLTRLGPFDTFSELPAAERAAYWIGLTLLLGVQILIALHLLRAPLARLHWTAVAAIAGLAGAVPSAFEVAWAESLLRVERDLGVVDLAAIYSDVLLIAIPLALAMRAVVPVDQARPDAVPPGDPARILAAIPPERRGALLAVAAEDHYLRVHTDRGEALILRRFGDALADLAGLDGARVHRGWWVARSAVARCEREGDRPVLVLTNGIRVPVSRTYSVAAREAGLLTA
ncbi:MAG TPA: LytTR family transcriptional regulator DNA-binding domain-containing protein [Allosphingosinicella sp.]|jgi:hypothetical protein